MGVNCVSAFGTRCKIQSKIIMFRMNIFTITAIIIICENIRSVSAGHKKIREKEWNE